MTTMQDAPAPKAGRRRPPTAPPGATIGMLGNGQLGRMFTQAAQRMGYRVHVFSSHANSPAGQVAEHEVIASFDDRRAVEEFAAGADVVTLEFENVPLSAMQWAARHAPVHPGGEVLHTVQHRLREKRFFTAAGIPCTPFCPIESLADLTAAVAELGCPAVLKTSVDGYDGKGQCRIDTPAEAAEAWASIGKAESLLEGFVDFQQELSVVAARDGDGSISTYGPLANAHRDHILDVTVLPHPDLQPVAAEAVEIARSVAAELKVIGLICVEFFLTADGRLLAGEIAPRPHNSGHLTIEACATSQFEQHVRTVCGLPLGSVEQLRPAAMANLLGELWADGPPHWSRALASDTVKLHLYGKHYPRPGRKMGHLTALADTPAEAERLVRSAREAVAD